MCIQSRRSFRSSGFVLRTQICYTRIAEKKLFFSQNFQHLSRSYYSWINRKMLQVAGDKE